MGKQKAILMYKVNNNCAAQYLQQLFTPKVSNHDLRNSLNKLSVPKPRTDYLKRSFSYSGASLWNSLSGQLRSAGLFSDRLHQVLHLFILRTEPDHLSLQKV